MEWYAHHFKELNNISKKCHMLVNLVDPLVFQGEYKINDFVLERFMEDIWDNRLSKGAIRIKNGYWVKVARGR